MRIEIGDLSSASITNLISALNKDVEDCSALKGALGDFIGVIEQRESLDGVSYQAVKGKLSSYQDIVEQRKTIANDLAQAIVAATGQMESYMGEYSYLDTAELDTIKTNLTNAKSELSLLNAAANGTRETTLSAAQISSRLLSVNQLIHDLEKKVEKLEGLPGADSSAFSNVSGVSMTSFNSSVGGMTPIQVNFTVGA